MLKLWRWYQNCLAVHPVKTQVISSGFIWGAGDVAAQYVTHYTAKTRGVTNEVVFFLCEMGVYLDTLLKKIVFFDNGCDCFLHVVFELVMVLF